MNRLTLPHSSMPPTAAQKLVDQLWYLTADSAPDSAPDNPQEIDYAAIDSTALQELRIWADAQYEQLTDENSSDDRRLQTARDLLPIAKILAKINKCPNINIDGEFLRKTRDVTGLRNTIQKLSGPFSYFYSAKSAQIVDLKSAIEVTYAQPEPMLQTIDAMLQKSADEARNFFRELKKVAEKDLAAAGQLLAQSSKPAKLKRGVDGLNVLYISKHLASLDLSYLFFDWRSAAERSASLAEYEQQLTRFTDSPEFLKHQAWLALTTESGLIKRTVHNWGTTNDPVWLEKAKQTEALVKAQGDLLYAEYITGTEGHSDRDGAVAGTRDATARKIVERELARMAEAAAQQQSTPPKLAPLRPDAVAVTRLNAIAGTEPHL